MNLLNERIGELYATLYVLQDGKLSYTDDGASRGGYLMPYKDADRFIEQQRQKYLLEELEEQL